MSVGVEAPARAPHQLTNKSTIRAPNTNDTNTQGSTTLAHNNKAMPKPVKHNPCSQYQIPLPLASDAQPAPTIPI